MEKQSVSKWVEKYSSKGILLDDAGAIDEDVVDIEESTPLVKDGEKKGGTMLRSRWENFKRRAPYYIPSSQWIPKYLKYPSFPSHPPPPPDIEESTPPGEG